MDTDPAVIGRYLLMALGAFLFIVTALGWYKKEAINALVVSLLLLGGFACTGIGTFGPNFMNDQTKWLNPLVGALSGNLLDQQTVLKMVGDGTIPDKYQPIALASAMETVSPETDVTMPYDKAIAAATDPRGRAALVSARQEVIQRAEVGEVLVDTLVEARRNQPSDTTHRTKIDLQGLSPTTRAAALRRIEALPESQAKDLNVDVDRLRTQATRRPEYLTVEKK